MTMDYTEAFKRLVKRIEATHGAPSVSVLEPQLKLRRVTAVWFIDGVNHGIHVDQHPDQGTGPRIEGWGTTGTAGFVSLVPPGAVGRRVLTVEHLEAVARLVGLLPADAPTTPSLGWPDDDPRSQS